MMIVFHPMVERKRLQSRFAMRDYQFKPSIAVEITHGRTRT
jgi:hypothetical protein